MVTRFLVEAWVWTGETQARVHSTWTPVSGWERAQARAHSTRKPGPGQLESRRFGRGDSRPSGGHNQPEAACGESGDGRQIRGVGPMLAERIGATRQFESPPQ
jgi:hypothetical protein